MPPATPQTVHRTLGARWPDGAATGGETVGAGGVAGEVGLAWVVSDAMVLPSWSSSIGCENREWIALRLQVSHFTHSRTQTSAGLYAAAVVPRCDADFFS